MKKILTLLLASVLALSAFAACAGGTGSSSSSQASQSESEAQASQRESEASKEQEAEREPYEIVLQLVNYGMDIPDLGLIEEKVNEIIQPQINATMKFATVPVSEQFMKLNLWVGGNEKIDLAMAGITTNPSNLVGQGVLMPITDYIANSEILSGLAADYLKAGVINGELYAYPGVLYPAGGPMYTYDAELAAQYNIEIPDSVPNLEALEPYLQKVKDSGMDIYPISFGDGVAATTQNLPDTFDAMSDTNYLANGVIMLDDPNETVVNIFASEEYKNMAYRQREWMEKGFVEPTSYSNGFSVIDALTAGQVFGTINATSVGASLSYWSSTTGKTLKGCWIGDTRSISSGGATNMSWCIPVTCENPERVIEFMELMYTDAELANLLNYGIEGKHYERVEGTEHIIRYPEGKNGFNCGYGTFINWYGDTKTTYQMVPAEDTVIAELDSFTIKGGAKLMPSFGYAFDATPVSTEMSAVTNVITEYRAVLECGLVEDVDAHLAQFIDALEKAGIDKIIEENQKQYDAWKASA